MRSRHLKLKRTAMKDRAPSCLRGVGVRLAARLALIANLFAAREAGYGPSVQLLQCSNLSAIGV
jgi:hypothetical protein